MNLLRRLGNLKPNPYQSKLFFLRGNGKVRSEGFVAEIWR